MFVIFTVDKMFYKLSVNGEQLEQCVLNVGSDTRKKATAFNAKFVRSSMILQVRESQTRQLLPQIVVNLSVSATHYVVCLLVKSLRRHHWTSLSAAPCIFPASN